MRSIMQLLKQVEKQLNRIGAPNVEVDLFDHEEAGLIVMFMSDEAFGGVESNHVDDFFKSLPDGAGPDALNTNLNAYMNRPNELAISGKPFFVFPRESEPNGNMYAIAGTVSQLVHRHKMDYDLFKQWQRSESYDECRDFMTLFVEPINLVWSDPAYEPLS